MGVLLLNRDELLNQFLAELRDEGYLVLECDGEASSTVLFEKSLRSALKFPRGSRDRTNRDAFRDHLGDLEFPGCTGIVVVIRNGEALHRLDSTYFRDIMDIFAGESHYHLCFGNRLGLVVQFRDKTVALPKIGGHRPAWDMRD